MPTITRVTSGMIAPAQDVIQNRVDALRSRFTAGNIILASDVNELNSIFTLFDDHYHQTVDYAFEAYGNLGYTTYYNTNPENTGSLVASEVQIVAGEVAIGDVITAEYHDKLRIMYEGADAHTHAIVDN